MSNHLTHVGGGSPAKWPPSGRRTSLALSLSSAFLLAVAAPAVAEAPLAGSVIGNQAIATFEAGGVTYSVTSNLVETTVNAVRFVDIKADGTKDGAIGGLVTFPHTITNVGNTPDSYTLAISGLTNVTSSTIYEDANCDGVPDATTGISATPVLNPGEQYCVVVEANVSSGAANNDVATFTITAASSAVPAVTDFNTDTITVRDIAPVLSLTKSVTLLNDADNSGSYTPGDTVRFRLTYSNSNPNTSAPNAVITDTLPLGLTYVANSGSWSDSVTPLTDVDTDTDELTNGVPESIDYSVSGQIVTANVDIVSGALTREGYIEFDATIDSTASGTLYNFAEINTIRSNEVPIPIPAGAAIDLTLADVVANDLSYAGRPITDLANNNLTTAGGDDVTIVPGPLAEGATATFTVVLSNHSNVVERFNLTANRLGTSVSYSGAAAPFTGALDFPAGTVFTFLTSNGAPLLDTDGSGTPDISVAKNASVSLQVRAKLPAGFSNIASSTTPLALITASSVSNGSVSDQTLLQLGDVVLATVDIENGRTLNAAGQGTGPDTGAVINNYPTNPGSTVAIPLIVENTSLAADSYNLSVSGLPLGWQIVFRSDPDGNLATADGTIVTNTGLIAPSGFSYFIAEVTPPANALATTVGSLTFTATSATNGAVSDSKVDTVTVNTIVDMELRVNRDGDVSPGGVLVLEHTLTNRGNITVNEGALSFNSGFPTLGETLYLDSNNDGVLTLGTDTIIDNIDDIASGLAPGASVTLFVRVQASASAVPGLSETATITVATSLNNTALTDGNPANNAVVDTVTIVAGDLEVVKEQRISANCTAVTASFVKTLLSADPGACIEYRITVTNTGTLPASSVTVSDTTPLYTTHEVVGTTLPSVSAGSFTTQPANGATGDIIGSLGVLAPGAVATMNFMVKIDD